MPLNYHLRPDPVAVLEGQIVTSDFHARFSATARLYHYRIVARRAPLALDRGRAWHIMRNLDAEAMHEGARYLVGQHDFTTFRAAECQAQSPVKTLDSLSVRRAGEEIHIDAKARSFLHHQMRSIAGTLSSSAKANGARAKLPPRLPRATVRAAARWHRRWTLSCACRVLTRFFNGLKQ